MATSGSYNYTATRDTLIAGALRLAGALGQGETPTTAQVNEAADALNLYVKFLSTKGVPIYGIRTSSAITLVANQREYNLNNIALSTSPKPLKLYSVVLRNTTTNIEQILTPLSTLDYNNYITGKQVTGTPTQYYYNPGTYQGVLTLWPVPEDNAVSTYNLYVVYQVPAQDFDASTDQPDFPVEWHDVIKYGLAVRLAGEYGLERFARSQLKSEYKEMFADVKGFDQENLSVYIQPDTEHR